MMMEILWWSFKKKMGVKTELIFIMYTLRLVLSYMIILITFTLLELTDFLYEILPLLQ